MDAALRLEPNYARKSALRDAIWPGMSGARNLDFYAVAGFVHDLVIGRYAKQGWIRLPEIAYLFAFSV